MCLVRFPISSGVSVGNLCLSRNPYLVVGFVHIKFIISHYIILSVVSSFSFLKLINMYSFIFLINVAKSYHYIELLKELPLGLINFLYCFFLLMFIISYHPLLLHFCSFFHFSRCKPKPLI